MDSWLFRNDNGALTVTRWIVNGTAYLFLHAYYVFLPRFVNVTLVGSVFQEAIDNQCDGFALRSQRDRDAAGQCGFGGLCHIDENFRKAMIDTVCCGGA